MSNAADPDSGSGILDILWSHGEVGRGAGQAGIVIDDLNGDGHTDVLTCGVQSPYYLNFTGLEQANQYYPFFYGESLDCSAIATADTDGDGVQELYIGSQRGDVYVLTYDGITYQRTDTIALAPDAVTALVVGDVDGDTNTEIVITRTTLTQIIGLDGTVEWTTFGGTGVAIGNVDTDTDSEIVVNGTTGYIVNGTTHSTEQTKTGGWGNQIQVVDVDEDGRAEIAYVREVGTDNFVGIDEVEGGVLANKWETPAETTTAFVIAEVDDIESGPELISGGAGDTFFRIRNANTGGLIRTFTKASGVGGVFGMAVGDGDGNGTPNLWWGVAQFDAPYESLYTSDLNSQARYGAPSYEGPFFVAEYNGTTDPSVEYAVLSSALNEADRGAYHYFDPISFFEEDFIINIPRITSVTPSVILAGQFDIAATPARELAVGGAFEGTARVTFYNQIQPVWEQSNMGTGSPIAAATGNVDADVEDELVVAAPNRKVYVLDATTENVDWESPVFPADLTDVAVADTDNDGAVEVAVLTTDTLYTYDPDGWTLKESQPVNSDGYRAAQVAAGNYDGTGAGEWLVVASKEVVPILGGGTYTARIEVLNGVTLASQWQDDLTPSTQRELLTVDVDGDGGTEFVVGGLQRLTQTGEQPTYLVVGEYDDTGYTVVADEDGYWGEVVSMVVTDRRNDGNLELLLGTTSLVQLRTLTTATEPTSPTISIFPGELTEDIIAPQEIVTQTLVVQNLGTVNELIYTTSESASPACTTTTDYTWFQLVPDMGTVPPTGFMPHYAIFDATGLPMGYNDDGYLCFHSNDPATPVVAVPIHITLTHIDAVELGALSVASVPVPVGVIVGIGIALCAALGIVVARRR